MLNNLLTNSTQSMENQMKGEINLQGLNWFEHEQTWVLLYFSTSWCAPCKTMAPIMDEVSTQFAGQLKTIKIDVDEQTKLAKQLDVRGVPTLVLFDKFGAKSRLVGGVTATQLNHWLSLQLKRNANH